MAGFIALNNAVRVRFPPPHPVYERNKMKTYFISGHLDLTFLEFQEHYAPLIKEAYENGANFVVGDARGADWLAQCFLGTLPNPEKRVKVFHMLEKPRNFIDIYENVGGFTSDEERDRAMTESSDEDIAWVRQGREKSGTARNLERRKKKR